MILTVSDNVNRVCHVKPCSFNGVYQPSLLDSFPTGPTLLLSYFYDRLAPLLAPPPASSGSKEVVDPTEEIVFPISLIQDLARVVCEGEHAWTTHKFPYPSTARGAPTHWGDSRETMEELKGRPEYCLDLSFMYALLRLGYEFGKERGVRIGKKVRLLLMQLVHFAERFRRSRELSWGGALVPHWEWWGVQGTSAPHRDRYFQRVGYFW